MSYLAPAPKRKKKAPPNPKNVARGHAAWATVCARQAKLDKLNVLMKMHDIERFTTYWRMNRRYYYKPKPFNLHHENGAHRDTFATFEELEAAVLDLLPKLG